MVNGDAGSISYVDGQRVHRKSILKINFGENPENKIEGNPILKFAMVYYRLKKKKKLSKKFRKIHRKNCKIRRKKFVKFVEKKIVNFVKKKS